MKRIICIIMFLYPFVGSTQQACYKSSQLDYRWKIVGNAGFSAGRADYTSLAFSPSGELYVAYTDWGNDFKATVMKYDGNNWVNVGNAGFSAGPVNFTCLACSPSDELYVAFNDDEKPYKASVMKFDGTNWIYVGNPGFSSDYGSEIGRAHV